MRLDFNQLKNVVDKTDLFSVLSTTFFMIIR